MRFGWQAGLIAPATSAQVDAARDASDVWEQG